MRCCCCHGSAMLMVLLILMVLALLGATLLNMTIIHTRIGVADRAYHAAYYYAEAGLQHQIEVMRDHMETLYRDPLLSIDENMLYIGMVRTPIKILQFDEYEGKKVRFKITSEYLGRVDGVAGFRVESNCKIDNIQRTVRARVDIRWVDREDSGFALHRSNFVISQWGEP